MENVKYNKIKSVKYGIENIRSASCNQLNLTLGFFYFKKYFIILNMHSKLILHVGVNNCRVSF